MSMVIVLAVTLLSLGLSLTLSFLGLKAVLGLLKARE